MSPFVNKTAVRRALRWGTLLLALHSLFLIVVTLSTFLSHGEGFILSRSQAGLALRFVDSPVTNLVYNVGNFHTPNAVWVWLADRCSSLDDVALLASTVLYLVFGGAFYFGIGFILGGAVSARGFLRKRMAG